VAEVKRAYSSAVRAEGAERTRRSVLDASAELFVERGYAATSLNDIAAAAGVARPTVFAAFGSKPAILWQLVDRALAGDDEPIPVAERPWFRPVWDATDQAGVLRAYAKVCTLIGERAARVFETVRRAADESAELAHLWNTLQTNRHSGAAMVARRVRALGPLRARLNLEAATDALWICNDPAHYGALVLDRGWSAHAFQAWLERQMRAAVLGD
jgi:AcrR family transcriptional regulator